jgi:hypothetical protein
MELIRRKLNQLWLKKLACAADVLSSTLTETFGGVSRNTFGVTLSMLPW